jgi:hypothetical protein
MSGESELGVMLYGYGKSQADIIGRFLGGLLGRGVAVLSGSGREADVVGDIIDGGKGPVFGEAEPRILMFLGFDDDLIGAVLSAFPRDGSVPRPIFCTLTESNIAWPLSQLVEHLLEEKRECERRRSG